MRTLVRQPRGAVVPEDTPVGAGQVKGQADLVSFQGAVGVERPEAGEGLFGGPIGAGPRDCKRPYEVFRGWAGHTRNADKCHATFPVPGVEFDQARSRRTASRTPEGPE